MNTERAPIHPKVVYYRYTPTMNPEDSAERAKKYAGQSGKSFQSVLTPGVPKAGNVEDQILEIAGNQWSKLDQLETESLEEPKILSIAEKIKNDRLEANAKAANETLAKTQFLSQESYFNPDRINEYGRRDAGPGEVELYDPDTRMAVARVAREPKITSPRPIFWQSNNYDPKLEYDHVNKGNYYSLVDPTTGREAARMANPTGGSGGDDDDQETRNLSQEEIDRLLAEQRASAGGEGTPPPSEPPAPPSPEGADRNERISRMEAEDLAMEVNSYKRKLKRATEADDQVAIAMLLAQMEPYENEYNHRLGEITPESFIETVQELVEAKITAERGGVPDPEFIELRERQLKNRNDRYNDDPRHRDIIADYYANELRVARVETSPPTASTSPRTTITSGRNTGSVEDLSSRNPERGHPIAQTSRPDTRGDRIGLEGLMPYYHELREDPEGTIRDVMYKYEQFIGTNQEAEVKKLEDQISKIISTNDHNFSDELRAELGEYLVIIKARTELQKASFTVPIEGTATDFGKWEESMKNLLALRGGYLLRPLIKGWESHETHEQKEAIPMLAEALDILKNDEFVDPSDTSGYIRNYFQFDDMSEKGKEFLKTKYLNRILAKKLNITESELTTFITSHPEIEDSVPATTQNREREINLLIEKEFLKEKLGDQYDQEFKLATTAFTVAERLYRTTGVAALLNGPVIKLTQNQDIEGQPLKDDSGNLINETAEQFKKRQQNVNKRVLKRIRNRTPFTTYYSGDPREQFIEETEWDKYFRENNFERKTSIQDIDPETGTIRIGRDGKPIMVEDKSNSKLRFTVGLGTPGWKQALFYPCMLDARGFGIPEIRYWANLRRQDLFSLLADKAKLDPRDTVESFEQALDIMATLKDDDLQYWMAGMKDINDAKKYFCDNNTSGLVVSPVTKSEMHDMVIKGWTYRQTERSGSKTVQETREALAAYEEEIRKLADKFIENGKKAFDGAPEVLASDLVWLEQQFTSFMTSPRAEKYIKDRKNLGHHFGPVNKQLFQYCFYTSPSIESIFPESSIEAEKIREKINSLRKPEVQKQTIISSADAPLKVTQNALSTVGKVIGSFFK